MENYIQYQVMGSVSQVRMKSGCNPTRFECQPDKRKRASKTTERPNILKKQRITLIEDSEKGLADKSTPAINSEATGCSSESSAIQREEEKLKKSLKDAATKNDKQVCTILAKEVIRSRKAINKIYTSKAHINSVQMQMKNQLATLRVAGSLQKSTEVMQAMQTLVRLPEVANTMRDMSKEMMKAGIIEEMLDETMSAVEDEEEMEDEAQSEVDKVLWELTQGKLGEAPAPPTSVDVPTSSKQAEPEPEPEENENELEEMQSRLQALRS